MVEVVELLIPLSGVVLLGVGAGAIRKGRFYLAQSERIADTEVSDVTSLRRGPVAIEGTARVDEGEGTVTASLSGEDALVSRAEVTARDSSVDDDRGPDRETLHEERRSIPFVVDDGTGTVRVDPPEEADVRLDDTVVITHSGDAPDASRLADRPEAADDGSVPVETPHRWRDARHRYEQGVVAPGEEVYVYGEAVDRADPDGPEFEIVGGENPRHFVVSDLSREDVRSGGKMGAYISYALGGALGVLGALLLFGGASALLWS